MCDENEINRILQPKSRNFTNFGTANIKYPYIIKMKKIKFFVLIVPMILISTCANAQNVFSDMQAEVDAWKSNALSADDNTSKTKQKKIKYDNYSVEASFAKDDLVSGQVISIFDAAQHTLLSGKVISTETPVSVQGITYDENGTEKLGTFEISNTSDGSFSFKPRKSDDLTIKCTSLVYVIASDAGNPVIINTKSKVLASRDKSSRNGYESLSASLTASIQPDKQIDVENILLALSNKIRIQWEDRVFEGKVRANGSSPVKFTTLFGTCTYENGKTVTVAKSGTNLTMKITDPSGNTENYVIPASNLDEQTWWSEKEFIKLADAYQKQLEKTSSSSNKVTSSSQKITSDSTPNKSSASSASSDNFDSKGSVLIAFLIIAAIILAPILFIRHLIHAHDCPHCGKKHAMYECDRQYMGQSKKETVKQYDGKYAQVYSNKYKIVRKCKYCGYMDYQITEEKG